MVVLETAAPRHLNDAAGKRRRSGKGGFRPDIEGLRALAVLAVALNHAGVPYFGGGFVGVDVFFVISGFLITGLLVRDVESNGRVRIVEFYARRARRILPAAALVLGACMIAGYGVAGSARGNNIAVDAVWAGLFAANWHFMRVGTDYFAQGVPTSPLQHFWSLGVEEQFYVVWPLILTLIVAIPLLRRRVGWGIGTVLVAICVSSFVFSIMATQTRPIEAYFSPFTRAWELGIGAGLAVALAYSPRLVQRFGPELAGMGLAMIAVAVIAFDASTPFPGYAALLPVAGTALVIAAGTGSRTRDVSALASGAVIVAALSVLLQRVLRSGPLQLIGQRSYGFYLWHLPFLQFAVLHFGIEPPLWVRIFLLAAAFAAADLTYLLLESPVRFSRVLRPRPVLSVSFGAALVGAVVSVSLLAQSIHRVALVAVTDSGSASTVAQVQRAVSVAMSEPAPAQLSALVDQSQVLWNPSWWGTCVTAPTQITPMGCVLGDAHGSRTWVLFGDSHVQMLMHPMDAIAHSNHVRLVVFTKAACGPYAGIPLWDTIRNQPFRECDAFIDAALARIRQLKPQVVVISGLPKAVARVGPGGKPAYFPAPNLEADWSAGEARTIAAAKAGGARVVVIGDIAEAPSDPATCLRAHLSEPQTCAGSESQLVYPGHNAAEKATAERTGATYVSMVDLMCSNGVCPVVIAGRVVYRDQWHLSTAYAMYLVNAIAERSGLVAAR